VGVVEAQDGHRCGSRSRLLRATPFARVFAATVAATLWGWPLGEKRAFGEERRAMADTLAWMGVFLGFAALSVAGSALSQLAALRKEVEKLKDELGRVGSR
jgi:hypothetical protein